MEPISASIAGLLALVGVAVILAGLFADRSRGRRRCAACGYVMDGLESREDGRTCPECGWVAKSERVFYRTRRRPGIVAAGVVALLLATCVAGWSRWDTVGPRMLPDAVLIRLAVLDQKDIRDELIRRIDEGLFSGGELERLTTRLIGETGHAEAHRSAFAEKAIDRLVLWVQRRAEDGAPDPEPRRRIVAGALGPFYAERLLRDPDPARRRDSVTWCELLASRSVEAKHALLAATEDPDQAVAEAPRYALMRGSWMLAGVVPDDVARQVSSGRMTWLRERVAPWVRERPPTTETVLTLARHLLDPTTPGAEHLGGHGDAGVGAGLILSTLGPTDEVFGVIADLADADTHGIDAIVPVRLLAAFGWRDETGPPLLAAIGHWHGEVRDAGWDVLEHFGDSAAIDPDELVAVIRRPEVDAERRAPEIAAALGVPRETLRDAGVGVLRAQLDAWRRDGGEPFVIEGRKISIGGGVVDWIADVTDPGDDEVIALMREMMFDTERGLGCRVARTYRRVSGDVDGVTRFVLDAYEQSIEDQLTGRVRGGERVFYALQGVLFDPNLDVDIVLEWIGTDELRANRVAQSCQASFLGRFSEEAAPNLERLLTAILEFDKSRDQAERVLERIRLRRDAEDSGSATP